MLRSLFDCVHVLVNVVLSFLLSPLLDCVLFFSECHTDVSVEIIVLNFVKVSVYEDGLRTREPPCEE